MRHISALIRSPGLSLGYVIIQIGLISKSVTTIDKSEGYDILSGWRVSVHSLLGELTNSAVLRVNPEFTEGLI